MTCREFERLWQETLDGPAGFDGARDRCLAAHAARCVGCLEAGRRYETLRQALLAWSPAAPPAGFADRVLAAGAGRTLRRVNRLPRVESWVGYAAAAVLVIAAGLALGARHAPPAPPARSHAPVSTRPRPLTDALAEATSATLDLARAASAPAARTGQRVLLTATPADLPTASAADLVPEPDPASGAFQEVGHRVNAGVRPLSGSARSAFGFLLRPARPGDRNPPAARSEPRKS
jgi:hypothetical protein